MTELGPWRLEHDGPLAVLTIDKPPLNLFDEEVFDGVIAAVDQVGRERPRALLVRAEGKVWTGGVDVNMFKGLTPETGGAVWRRGFELIQAVEDLPFPVIFAAHALTLTWGFELALACDLLDRGDETVEDVVGEEVQRRLVDRQDRQRPVLLEPPGTQAFAHAPRASAAAFISSSSPGFGVHGSSSGSSA